MNATWHKKHVLRYTGQAYFLVKKVAKKHPSGDIFFSWLILWPSFLLLFKRSKLLWVSGFGGEALLCEAFFFWLTYWWTLTSLAKKQSQCSGVGPKLVCTCAVPGEH